MRLANEQYEEIKRTVIDTFLEYDIKCIPINAFEAAMKMGITIIPYSALREEKRDASLKLSRDGYSLEDNDTGEWVIYYNDACKNYGRINQTIMHEIGHYAMEHTKDGEEEEAEAKFFAKYALAPPPLVHTLLSKIKPETIMKSFDISWEAAKNAYWYYKTWLYNGEREYTDYEEKIIDLFAEGQNLIAHV